MCCFINPVCKTLGNRVLNSLQEQVANIQLYYIIYSLLNVVNWFKHVYYDINVRYICLFICTVENYLPLAIVGEDSHSMLECVAGQFLSSLMLAWSLQHDNDTVREELMFYIAVSFDGRTEGQVPP